MIRLKSKKSVVVKDITPIWICDLCNIEFTEHDSIIHSLYPEYKAHTTFTAKYPSKEVYRWFIHI